MGGFGIQELLIILLIAVIIFGAKKIPELGKSLGIGISEFKKGLSQKDNISEEASKKENL